MNAFEHICNSLKLIYVIHFNTYINRNIIKDSHIIMQKSEKSALHIDNIIEKRIIKLKTFYTFVLAYANDYIISNKSQYED